ncbi:MAG: hypothetical protein CSA96_04100 [Bacteroidetes bacterium]|nr:MAG: hypothetical protein CSA96_04100 [Bacteroidota bacterium]
MLCILGPAKTIDLSPHGITDKGDYPGHLDSSAVLVELLRKYDIEGIRSLMKVSEKLATQTFERYASWQRSYEKADAQQAILAFSGEVFNGLQARSLGEADLLFAQDHVRILSGLYGVLRPLDFILPYRLEMGTKLENPSGPNLYDFWADIIPKEIAQLAGKADDPVLINLASREYFRSIAPAGFPYRIITPVFKESDGNGYRSVSIYAKKARGMMLRFIIRNRIKDPGHLKAFDEDGYQFMPALSGKDEWFFCR